MIKCDKCDGEMKLERKSNKGSWYNVYRCQKCGAERMLTFEERTEFNG